MPDNDVWTFFGNEVTTVDDRLGDDVVQVRNEGSRTPLDRHRLAHRLRCTWPFQNRH